MQQERPEELRNSETEDESLELTATPAVEEISSEWKFSLLAKAEYIFAGVILPVICFCANTSDFLWFDVDWQSGEFSDYCSLLFAWKSCLPFYPFLLYPMACMMFMVVRPVQYSQRFMVRFGIYTGVVLAVQYFILLAIATSGVFLVVSAIVTLILWSGAWLIVWLIFRHGDNWPAIKLLRVVVCTALILIAVFYYHFCIFCSLICSTPWAVIAYSMMTWRLIRRNGREPWQFSLAQLFAFVSWLAAYLSAWRMSVNLMLIEYAKLPTTPPEDCYVCTAAARGHRRFVGSQEVIGDTGNVFLINNQTRYLKAAEIVLAGTWPRLHRLARAVYDRVGPPAAKLLVYPLAADAAYLAMKPAEWTARAFLAVALPQASQMARLFYRECRN